MPHTLTLSEAEYQVVKSLLKEERDEARHEIHKAEWKHRDELKKQLELIESLLARMENTPTGPDAR